MDSAVTSWRAVASAAAVVASGVMFGYAAWAQQTQRPEAAWTPSADAPAGVLSHALEGQRHDQFIDLAQKGDIDLVFFGTTPRRCGGGRTAAKPCGIRRSDR